ncbi:MAG: HDOD domain-containing protein [Undibacterium sp.]|jgi:HD-like signal output (HDOD) protein|uniref:HDOD domain-containing protein n=1 Tax=Undibacterium sp. TaxID=1914977 RepID=UPI002728CA40|nr:HDOD domain-containing protein [Undibacterium sp.]MDO8653767.1 HDOD domain-containing protein [Undibacterium sp.]
MNKTEALNTLIEQANRGELVFSTNVATSLKIQKALDDPDCSVDTASKLVLNEPLLSARVVAIANSAVYSRMGNDVNNVRAAITRLGFRTLRSVVASLVVRQLAGSSKDPAIRAMVNKLWEHSAQVAALAQVLARRITKLDPDTAMFAGIVHEVGGFYMLSRAEEFPCLLERDDLTSDLASNDLVPFSDTIIDKESAEAIIGRAVLKNLQMPQPVVDAVEALWYGLRAMPPESLGDTLLLANELASTPSPLDTRTDSESNRYTSEIDFVVGDGTLNSILEESKEEVISLSAALTS